MGSAFSTCRKYEDDISPAIFVCNINPKALLSQLKSMSTNVKSLKTLKTIIDSLTSRKFRYTRSIKNCDGVITKVDETTTLTKSNPASSKIDRNVKEIQAAKEAGVTCSSEQKKRSQLSKRTFKLLPARRHLMMTSTTQKPVPP